MGKKGGFMEIGRKGPDYRSVDRRLKDFAPVELRLGPGIARGDTQDAFEPLSGLVVSFEVVKGLTQTEMDLRH